MTNEELVEKIQQGIDVQENMGILYEQNKNLIRKFVLPYSKRIEIEDLMQEAYFGIHQAALRFDINSENKFMSYAQYWIISKINMYYRNNGRLKRLPSYMIEQLSKYYKFIDEYKSMNDEDEPSDLEIIQKMNITQKQLNDIKKIVKEDTMVSLQSPTIEDSTIEDVIADKTSIEEEICEDIFKKEMEEVLWNEVDELENENQKEVIITRYKNNKSLKDIAIIKNVSKERIRQIEHEGLKKLRYNENIKKIASEYSYNTSLGYKGNLSSFKNNNASVVEMMVIKKIEKENEILKKFEKMKKENEILKRIKQMEDRRKKLLDSLI